MLKLDNQEINFAITAVRQATLLVKQIQAELVSPALTKDDRSPVTVADFAAQALVGYLLSQAFPSDFMIAEEDSTALTSASSEGMLEQVASFIQRHVKQATPNHVCEWIDFGRTDTANRFWTLDPIDGTKGFLRGDQYAVALALIEDGIVQIGVLGCPNITEAWRPDLDGDGSLVVAARGQGTWTMPVNHDSALTRLQVSPQKLNSQARLLRSFESGHTNVSQIDVFAEALGIEAEPVRMDSQAKYAVLAAGKGELLLRLLSPSKLDYREKIWDQAAGSLVLEEAGGQITDLDGKPLNFNTGRSLTQNRGILASNGNLHAAALQELKQIGA
jgi:3'(2'), 5'-bisphosphate nucleotidase